MCLSTFVGKIGNLLRGVVLNGACIREVTRHGTSGELVLWVVDPAGGICARSGGGVVFLAGGFHGGVWKLASPVDAAGACRDGGVGDAEHGLWVVARSGWRHLASGWSGARVDGWGGGDAGGLFLSGV